MNVQSVIFANDHLQDLRRDAAQRRMIKSLPRTTLRQRLASIAGTLASVATPASVAPAAH